MRVGSFSVLIPEGRERDSGHVVLRHGQVYRIRLGNHHNRRCDAEVKVDGKPVGCFRLDPSNHGGHPLTLERPSHDTGCFTFLEAHSHEAQAADVGAVGHSDRGLVEVVFRVERAHRPMRSAWSEPFMLRAHDDGTKSAGNWQCTSGSLGGGTTPAQNYTYGSVNGGDGAALCAFAPHGTATYGDVRMRSLSAGITGLTGHSSQTFHDVPQLVYDPGEETRITLRLVSDDGIVRPLTAVRANAVPVPV